MDDPLPCTNNSMYYYKLPPICKDIERGRRYPFVIGVLKDYIYICIFEGADGRLSYHFQPCADSLQAKAAVGPILITIVMYVMPSISY